MLRRVYYFIMILSTIALLLLRVWASGGGEP